MWQIFVANNKFTIKLGLVSSLKEEEQSFVYLAVALRYLVFREGKICQICRRV
jgi:hypothetical protein